MPIPATIDPVTTAAVLAVFLLGGIVKGALGFGLPLTAMAILPFLISVEAALAINALILVATNVAQFVQMRQMRETVLRFAPVLWGIAIGVAGGTAMVSLFSDDALLVTLGGAVVGFTALSVAAPNLRLPPAGERPFGFLAGISGGVLMPLTTVGGPMYVMYLVGLSVDRRVFLSAVSLFLLVSSVLIVGAFIIVGMFDGERLLLAALALPAAIAGMSAGNRLGARLPAARFRMLVLGILGVLGLNLLWRGLSGG